MRGSERQVRGQGDKHRWEKWGHEIICPGIEDMWVQSCRENQPDLLSSAGPFILFIFIIEKFLTQSEVLHVLCVNIGDSIFILF